MQKRAVMRYLLIHIDEVHYQCKLYCKRFLYDIYHIRCIN